MNIPNERKENFEDRSNFYQLCFLLCESAVYEILKIVYEILKIGSVKRRHFINNIFQSPSRESSFPV
jgi:hypothetical protein